MTAEALTGRELNAAVARVLGCDPQPSRIRPGEYHCGCPDHRHNAESECEGYLLEYASDPAASAALRDELLRREAEWSMFRRPGWCHVYLALPGVGVVEAEAPTEEAALARAALLALSPPAPA